MLNRFEKFTFFIEEVARVLHKIMGDEMSFFGLKGSFAIYILILADQPDGITVSSIAEKMRQRQGGRFPSNRLALRVRYSSKEKRYQ